MNEVTSQVYESAVKGRQEFRNLYRDIREINRRLNEQLEALKVAARAFENGLSEDCDGPERDALRALIR